MNGTEDDLSGSDGGVPLLSPTICGVWFERDHGDIGGSLKSRDVLEYQIGPFADFEGEVRILEEAAAAQ